MKIKIGIEFLNKIVAGIISMILLFFFTTITKDIAEENARYGTIEEIQAKINFKIMQPTYLPPPYKFINAYSASNDCVSLRYSASKGLWIILHEKWFVGDKNPQRDFGSGEEVMIHGLPGRFGGDKFGFGWYSKNLTLIFYLYPTENISKDELVNIAKSVY